MGIYFDLDYGDISCCKTCPLSTYIESDNTAICVVHPELTVKDPDKKPIWCQAIKMNLDKSAHTGFPLTEYIVNNGIPEKAKMLNTETGDVIEGYIYDHNKATENCILRDNIHKEFFIRKEIVVGNTYLLYILELGGVNFKHHPICLNGPGQIATINKDVYDIKKIFSTGITVFHDLYNMDDNSLVRNDWKSSFSDGNFFYLPTEEKERRYGFHSIDKNLRMNDKYKLIWRENETI